MNEMQWQSGACRPGQARAPSNPPAIQVLPV